MKYLSLVYFLSLLLPSTYANYLDEHVQTFDWNGIEVVWLEDNSLPTYEMLVYFDEGSLTEEKKLKGSGELMFSQLTSGTNRYTQKQIISSLEFYGARYLGYLTHEHSVFQVSGLVKDYVPTLNMICHLFDDATFPQEELAKVKKRIMSSIQTIVTQHSELASHIFRYESLKGTGYETPTSGDLATLENITSKDLSARLKDYNKKIGKKIYLKGPKEILGVKSIIQNKCKWDQKNKKSEYLVVKKLSPTDEVIFVDVGQSNQAQVRVGRVLMTDEVVDANRELQSFAAKFMGGGFTSQLVQGLRVERGLTYSAMAYAAGQKKYGRAGISTFTRNETLIPLLDAIKDIINKSSTEIPKDRFLLAKRNIKGNYLLGLESTSEFLKTLMFKDHIDVPYADIYKFSDKIDNVSVDDLKGMISDIFAWNKQTIVVLGSKDLIKPLKENGYKVKMVDYKDYL
ncbi:MAG: hypothetical protein CME62_17665 [Halobacteriovoraceae bacterium]|nr:hypothetical protein [Halobacteriovoraceae bacterium]|tara:strand:+ start:8815 stop:10182 length:1368 start_codon:yes stop_codon:yes gene_type:complete